MPTLNVPNRTLFHGDNLDFLRGINSESVDLIATDPPFNKNKDFHATPDSLASGASFQDRWSWRDDIHDDWLDALQASGREKVWAVISGAKQVYGDDMGAFLCFLAVRLLEMHRVLKPTGSLYLHIDHTAHAYVKCLLDAIFGKANFQNEIVWTYTGGTDRGKGFQRKHDTLLFYSKSSDFTWNPLYVPFAESTINRFNKVDDDGRRYKVNTLKDGRVTRTYMKEEGKLAPDYIHLNILVQSHKEATGYPTQKPLALYERIIKASSNPGDVVLDPFCGCATTPVAAERLGRQWVGMDLWAESHNIILNRLEKEGLAGPDGSTDRLINFGEITFTSRPPRRTDGQETAAVTLETPTGKGQRYPAPRTQHANLLADIGPFCQGCGRDYSFDPRVLEVDHKLPKADGGNDVYHNLTLLCPPCNKEKRDRYTLTGLQEKNRGEGQLTADREGNIRHGTAGRRNSHRRPPRF